MVQFYYQADLIWLDGPLKLWTKNSYSSLPGSAQYTETPVPSNRRPSSQENITMQSWKVNMLFGIKKIRILSCVIQDGAIFLFSRKYKMVTVKQ